MDRVQVRFICMVAALCLTVGGCMSHGTNFDSNKVSSIKKHQTTEAELVQMFGEPDQRGEANGKKRLTWTHVTVSMSPLGVILPMQHSSQAKSLMVTLTPDGTVEDYDYRTNSEKNF